MPRVRALRPVTRARTKALEESRCNFCCQEIIAMKPLGESNSNGKKPKSRLHNVACTSLIPKDVFDAAIMKRGLTDDSDSDVEDSKPLKKKRRTKCTKTCRVNSEKCPHERTETAVIPDLPDEMWLKIFQLMLNSAQYPTMHRLQLVCHRWRRLSLHPSLWKTVDLSCGGTRWIPYRDSTLEWLSKYRMRSVQRLSLRGWHCLTARGVEQLAMHCPDLRAVELGFCSNINRDAIYILTKHCKDLNRVNLANTTSDVVCIYPMVHLAKVAGAKLKSLDLSGNLLNGFNTVMSSICENCPNMEELDIGRCRGDMINIDVEYWQKCLPNMQALSLSYSVFQTVKVPQQTQSGQGWPKLRALSLAMSVGGGIKIPPPVDDVLLRRFLWNSRGLRQLDVRGCRSVSARTMLDLDFTDIRGLELGVVSDASEGGLEQLMVKYGDHLEEVNISWTNYSQSAVKSAMQALIRSSGTCLRLLFLARSQITVQDVVDIITLRPQLSRIELKECAHLPHDWCKLFNTESRMKRLHRLVAAHVEDEKRKEGVNGV